MPEGSRFFAFRRSADGSVDQPTDEPALRRALAEREGLVWVDLAISSEADATVLRDVFRFHPLTIEDCVSPRVDPAKVDDHGEYLFIVVQSMADFSVDRELTPAEVDFYLGPNYVVSCHRRDLPAIAHYRERCHKDPELLARGPDWLLHGLLDALVDEYLPVVDALDDVVDEIEESVLQRPDPAALQRLMLVRRNTLRLRRATTPERDVMARLSRGEHPRLVRPEMSMYYRDIYDHLVQVEYLVESVRDLTDGAVNTYLSTVSNRLNEVMKLLTAAAAVFLPLTLISSIYGMNFVSGGTWPPFESDWGFGAVTGAMVAIALALLVYFRYRRWV